MYNFIMLITPQTGPEPNTIHVGSETLKVLKSMRGAFRGPYPTWTARRLMPIVPVMAWVDSSTGWPCTAFRTRPP